MASPRLHTVFVPGLLCSARLYAPVLPTAWAYGAVTVADNRRDDTIGAMAARLLDDAPERFVLVGLSMGGYVAHEVLRQAPERVSGLALISTSARPDTAAQRESRQRQRQTVLQGGFDALVEAIFPVLPDPANVSDEQLLAGWRLMAGDVGAEAFARQLEAVMARPDSRPGLAAVSCPTAVIHGTGDRLITPDNATETASAIPDAVLTMVDRAGHMLPQEQPAALQAALTALLDRVAAVAR
ncbi:MAG TPA: alpha/beta hydrolase [Propionicimonas sp.]|jgi:pimeloyl-ACP methyl ester carboxylesterase